MVETSSTAEVKRELQCSFCERSRDETGPLIEKGSDLTICRQCVEWFLEVYERREAGETGTIERPRQ